MTEVQARQAAAEVLIVEANVLAGVLGGHGLDTLPNRVAIAVRTEMNRLREIARVLTVDDIKLTLDEALRKELVGLKKALISGT